MLRTALCLSSVYYETSQTRKIISQAKLTACFGKKRVVLRSKCCIWKKNLQMPLHLGYCLEIF